MIGYSLAIAAAFCASAKDLVSKRLSFNINGTLNAFASFAFAVPLYAVLLPILYALGLETFQFSVSFFGLVFLRALSDMGAEWTKMCALARGDISLVSCVIALSPLFLIVASPLITGDPLTPYAVGAVGCAVCGTLTLLYRPGMKWKHAERKSILFGFAAAFCFALNNCFDRLAVQIASPALSAAFMTTIVALMLAPFGLRQQRAFHQLRGSAGYFGLRAVFEVTFMVVKLGALQYLQAPYVVCLMQIALLFSILGGKVLFNEGEFLRRLLAGSLILTGVVLVFLAQ